MILFDAKKCDRNHITLSSELAIIQMLMRAHC
jgi:hypothetical protein